MKTASHTGWGLLFAAAAGLAASYLASSYLPVAFPYSGIWKASGIVLLGVFAVLRGRTLIGAGLLTCSIGDFMLEFTPPQWTLGMAAFGAGHLIYTASFLKSASRSPVTPLGWGCAAATLMISAAMALWFLPDMGELQIPGLAYQAVITGMTATAFITGAPLRVRIGASIFMLSDSLIALDLYKGIQPPGGSVWVTYALAQCLLAWTSLNARSNSEGSAPLPKQS